MTDNGGDRFTGHGSEWTDANLSKEDAHVATVWVDQIVNRRSMLTNKARVEEPTRLALKTFAMSCGSSRKTAKSSCTGFRMNTSL